MTLDVYVHVFDEFDIAERVFAEDQIIQARRDVSDGLRRGDGFAGIPWKSSQPHQFAEDLLHHLVGAAADWA
jgi:hypothetical protein